MTQQVERALTRPWGAATVVAAVFVALERLAADVDLFVFWRGSLFGGDGDPWDFLRSEWSLDLTFLVVGVVAGYVLWRAAQAGITYAWPSLILRAVIIYIPTRIVLYAVIGFIWALTHGRDFEIFGLQLLS